MESGKDTEITDEVMLIARAKDAHVQSDAYAVGLSRSISIARRVGGFFAPTYWRAPWRTTVCVGTSRCFYVYCRAVARGNQSAGKRIREGMSDNRSRCGSFSGLLRAPARAPNQTHGRAGVFYMGATV